jgi:hypothetical protein
MVLVRTQALSGSHRKPSTDLQMIGSYSHKEYYWQGSEPTCTVVVNQKGALKLLHCSRVNERRVASYFDIIDGHRCALEAIYEIRGVIVPLSFVLQRVNGPTNASQRDNPLCPPCHQEKSEVFTMFSSIIYMHVFHLRFIRPFANQY